MQIRIKSRKYIAINPFVYIEISLCNKAVVRFMKFYCSRSFHFLRAAEAKKKEKKKRTGERFLACNYVEIY